MDGCGRWEMVEEGLTDAAAHVLQKLRRYFHLCLDDLIGVGIRDGAGQGVAFHSLREININREVDDEISPHGVFLGQHAVVGKYPDVLQQDLRGLSFQCRCYCFAISRNGWLRSWYKSDSLPDIQGSPDRSWDKPDPWQLCRPEYTS